MRGTLEQKENLRTRGTYMFLGGLLAFSSALALLVLTQGKSEVADSMASFLMLFGAVEGLVGSCNYALSKGYGLIYGFFGLVTLAFLPDLYKVEDSADTQARSKASLC